MERRLIVLIADDHLTSEPEGIEDAFSRENFPCTVFGYTSATRVMNELREKTLPPYDIALIDLEFRAEQGGGEELIAAMKHEFPDRPIITISGYEVHVGDADGQLIKPYFTQEAIDRIKDHIRR